MFGSSSLNKTQSFLSTQTGQTSQEW